MRCFFKLVTLFVATAHALPHYAESLAGFSSEEIARAIQSWPTTPGAQPIPPAIGDTSSKLIYDANHPFVEPGPDDIRGPCPGLNTLANHGYLNRNGIVTPGEIIIAVQEGFNMDLSLASFITYASFIVDGNHLTNLMSIGGKTKDTGPDPPKPAIVGGLNTHGVFEGDASTTRSDDALGDNHNFNETLFKQLSTAAEEFGNGMINFAASAEHRYNRIKDSMARNPSFDLTSPRTLTAYAETVFPLRFFANGTDAHGDEPFLSVKDARSFFQHGKFPEGFFRREGAFTGLVQDLVRLYTAHPTQPGKNHGVGNFVVDKQDPGIGSTTLCYGYKKQASQVITSLYPNPQGALREAIKANLKNLYISIGDPKCEEQFPYGE